ncbi:phosphopantetheine-binding protein [Nocardia jinanensis]|uniref:phosphopantetheine-binding protein n=1 Tax=Nocardia jinanensis TaxID=382504 RepID=UPI00073851B5|nr:phosphopantetheine-binding protein [Nocardia jinanensis]
MTNEPVVGADRDHFIRDVADLLGVAPEELSTDTNLLDAGLDSVRIMQLVEKWRSEGHETVDPLMLAGDPVLESWLEVLCP